MRIRPLWRLKRKTPTVANAQEILDHLKALQEVAVRINFVESLPRAKLGVFWRIRGIGMLISMEDVGKTALRTALAIDKGNKAGTIPQTEVVDLLRSVSDFVGLRVDEGSAGFHADVDKVDLVGNALRDAKRSLSSEITSSANLLSDLSKAASQANVTLKASDLEVIKSFCLSLHEQILRSRYLTSYSDLEERTFELA